MTVTWGDHNPTPMMSFSRASTMATRLGIEEGTVLSRPIVEFSYKEDSLGDPLVAEEHILALEWATQRELDEIIAMAFSDRL